MEDKCWTKKHNTRWMCYGSFLIDSFCVGWYATKKSILEYSYTMPENKPNILLIMSDEHAPMFSGPYGHPLVQTPHMDRLAKEGVTFTNALLQFTTLHAFTDVVYDR